MTFMAIAEVRADGVIFELFGDQIRLSGKRDAIAKHVHWIKDNKAELINILRQEALGVIEYDNQRVCAAISRFIDIAIDHPSAAIAMQMDRAFCKSWETGKEVAETLLPAFEKAVGILSGDDLRKAVIAEFYNNDTKPSATMNGLLD